jgi:hypothetical protein
MRSRLGRRAHPVSPGAPFVVVLVVLGLLAAGCGDDGPPGAGGDRGVPPAPPAVSPPVPTEDQPRSEPTPGLVEPIAGHRSRRVRWRLVQVAGNVVVVEVQAGGAPCDAVTGIDVAESAGSVELAIWAGRTPGARCRGVPAVLGTFRVRVPLDAPLGDRTLRRG